MSFSRLAFVSSLLSLSAIATAVACSSNPDDTTPPPLDAGPGPGPDAAPSADGGPVADSGPIADSGPATDAGPGEDASPGAEAGPFADPCDGATCVSLPPSPPTACASLGSVHFHLLAPNGDAGQYEAVVYAWLDDPIHWFSITAADAGALQLVPPTYDNAAGLTWSPSCSSCQSIGALAPLQSLVPVGDAGVSGTWSGTSYSLTSTCTDPTNGTVGCGDVLCAPAGSYVVKMCATALEAQTPQCVSVPFTFPGTADVTGTLGQ